MFEIKLWVNIDNFPKNDTQNHRTQRIVWKYSSREVFVNKFLNSINFLAILKFLSHHKHWFSLLYYIGPIPFKIYIYILWFIIHSTVINKFWKDQFLMGRFTKYDSKLDFDCKSIPKLGLNAKLTQKPCEITTSPLWPNKKTNTNISPLSLLSLLRFC